MKRILGIAVALGAAFALVTTAQQPNYPHDAQVSVQEPAREVVATHDCNGPANPVDNCGFETGNFTDWVTQDLANPFQPLTVSPAGTGIGYGFFNTDPAEGSFSATTGWDGDGPGTIIVAQDVTLPPLATTLDFNYRGAWDLASFGATQDRTFTVEIEPAGGGTAMQSDLILTAEVGTIVTDTGPLEGSVDVSGFEDSTVRISFEWFVPEAFVGPAWFELDNILVSGDDVPVELIELTVTKE